MSIKSDMQPDAYDLIHFLNETAEKGVILSISTAGSGVAMDSTSNVVTLAASSSGAKPVGLLLTEFVDLDLTRQPVNWHKNQSNVGEKASIMTKGWVTTDQIYGTPSAGQWAVLSSSGVIRGIDPKTTLNEDTTPRVGTFRTSIDEAGFASVYIDL